MSAKSAYLAAELLKFATNQANDLGTPVVPWLALIEVWTPGAPPGDATFAEVTGDGYLRVQTSTKWTAPAAGEGNARVVVTNADIEFDAMTADKQVQGIALFDDPEDGNLLYSKALGVTLTVLADAPVLFAAGDLSIQED